MDLDTLTIANQYYRLVHQTIPGKMQLVLMCLLVGEDIPKEIHPHTAQFIKIVRGRASVIIGGKEYILKAGDYIIVPPNTHHYVTNISKTKALHIYTIYTPPEHPPHRKQKRQP
jgi:mannose-6-phosphate isomerase-like protein (cupin superfamily)